MNTAGAAAAQTPPPSAAAEDVDLDSLLFVGAYGTVHALERATGNTVWRSVLRGTGCGSGSLVTLLPAVVQGLIVCGCRGKVVALRMKDGVEVWHNSLPKLRFGNVTVSSMREQHSAAAKAAANAAAAVATAAAAAAAVAPNNPPSSVDEGSGERSGDSRPLDSADRSPSLRGFLQYPSPDSTPPLSPQASTTGMLGDSAILDAAMHRDLSGLAFIATSGEVRALDVRRGGEMVWNYRLPARGSPFVNLLFAGGTLFAGGASCVIALDPLTGQQTWRNDLYARWRTRVTLATATSAACESSQPVISTAS
ncbi:hypothetical protein CBR_g30520 [Chara braunii]|uniref:Pyrrolo-quinoline quinone repeat domain-containing protein n=1 Tax=Chara braunii TaxID=69332 RepID=A0A388LD69_CHABU|nr:hypothetical protein CBR_g30520 [Chara braunii]|eukprot:GBG80152.1 hypothetical protein CBR_g30520 [Chara braunii]